MHGAREECKNVCVSGRVRSSRREAHGERTSPTFGGFFQSATLSCVETEDGEEEEAMIYKGASLLRAIGQLEGSGAIGKRGEFLLSKFHKEFLVLLPSLYSTLSLYLASTSPEL